jgi:hypothetical protein
VSEIDYYERHVRVLVTRSRLRSRVPQPSEAEPARRALDDRFDLSDHDERVARVGS